MVIYLNIKLSNQKAQFVAREHEINRDITPYVINYVIISEPAFLLTMFHQNTHFSASQRRFGR